MSSVSNSVRDRGWLLTGAQIVEVACRRMRDALLSRKLGAPGFRAGRQPRILGVAGMKLGRDVHAADSLWLEAVMQAGSTPQLVLGDRVWMSDRVHIACLHRIEIGSGTLVGSDCLISDHAHGSYSGDVQTGPDTPPAQRPLSSAGSIRIGRNVWLGDGVKVLAGAVIGDGAVIGAGSLVKGTIPPATMAVGTPARVIRRWDALQQQWVRTID